MHDYSWQFYLAKFGAIYIKKSPGYFMTKR
jgi:hypothetical protein